MFLSGALDDTSKLSLPTPAVPVTPKQEGPAWGGAKITKGPASLRDIQSEQRSKTNELMTTKAKDRNEDSPDSAGLLRLSSFMPDACSSPISVTPARAVPAHEGDKSTPPWSSSATSPNLSRPSLRDIQMQQVDFMLPNVKLMRIFLQQYNKVQPLIETNLLLSRRNGTTALSPTVRKPGHQALPYHPWAQRQRLLA